MTVRKTRPQWACQTFDDHPNVFPLGDTRDHVMTQACWCGPRAEGSTIIHNSADRREENESGERKPS